MKVWQQGDDLPKVVRCILSRLGDPAVWCRYSLKGLRGKVALERTKAYQLLLSKLNFIIEILGGGGVRAMEQ